MDLQATFVKRFGDLVTLLRIDPGNDAAQDLALTAAGAAITHGPVQVEASEGASEIVNEWSLQARLLARRVDAIRITPEVDLSELLALARALAHDTTPLPASPNIEVALSSAVDLENADGPEPPSAGSAARNRQRGPERREERDRRRATYPRWPGLERRHRDRRINGERRLRLLQDVRM